MKKKKINIALLFLFLLNIVACQHKTDAIEKKIDSLISQMTTQEKLGQMNQISPDSDIHQMKESIKAGQVGSILNVVNPREINQLQKIAVEESRLGIPILMSRDVIHGFKTIFPIPLGQAATFNPEIAFQGARVSAIEASSVGIRWTFAPMIDIARDARWGRMAEGCGEDPYLTSVFGAAMVRGFQGDSLNSSTSIAACAKHFVGYGASESGKDYNSTFIPERLLRNVYLPPFYAAVQAGCASFMTSFNDNNGVPSSGNSFILKDVLRKEWGFNGFVVSDWASVQEMVTHGFAENDAEAAQKAINAGLDMEMVSGTYIHQGEQLLREKKITEEQLNTAVRNILRIKFKLGLFEDPYIDLEKPSVMYAPLHLAKAKQAAIESAILLKNDGILPLKETIKKVLIVGPLADAPYEQMGTWVFDGEKEHTITPLKALREQYGDAIEISYLPVLAYSRDKNTNKIAAAVKKAYQSDVVIAFVGEESILSGEAHCLAEINLKGAQSQLLKALSSTKTPLVTVIMAGRPLTIAKELNYSNAMLYAFHPGTMGGPALADLLMGDAVPSGKTPVTFPQMTGQVPIYYAHHKTGRPAAGTESLIDMIAVESGQTSTGCTSFHMDAGFTPLFPFGYGLSYTTFEYDLPKLSSQSVTMKDTLLVTCRLKNTGHFTATEVVQLYVQDCVGSVTRPVKELKGFQRVELKPSESKEITFKLPVQQLAFWNIEMKEKVEPGKFNIWVAGDSQSGQKVSFRVL
jgi:beta-glucosidase